MDPTTESVAATATDKYGRRYSQAQREELLGRYLASGLKLSAFAREADVSETALKRWMGGGVRRRPARLVALRVQEPESTVEMMVEARFGCGTVLRVPPAALADLVAALRRPC
jgi:transposase-like protein